MILRIIALWNEWWFKPTSPNALGIYRIILFLGNLFFLYRIFSFAFDLGDCQSWNPSGVYYIFSFPCARALKIGLYISSLVFSIFALFGICYSITGKMGAISSMLFFGYDYNFYRFYHGYHMFVMCLLIVGFSQAQAAYSFGKKSSPLAIANGSYAWPLQWAKLYIVYVYFIAGAEKLYFQGFSWAFSENLFLSIFSSDRAGLLKRWILNQPVGVSIFIACWSLFVCELLAPLALINRTWGKIYWFIWLFFHVGVHLTLGAHSAFFSQIVASVVFLIPLRDPSKLK